MTIYSNKNNTQSNNSNDAINNKNNLINKEEEFSNTSASGSVRKKREPSKFNAVLLDELLKDYNYQNPEELIGSNGLLKQLKKALIERALEGELNHHLGYNKHSKTERESSLAEDYRNGYAHKNIITDDGDINIQVPRDRNSDFEPQIVKKRQTRFTGFDDKIISMYSRGMTLKEIQEHLLDIYGTEVSTDFISTVTDSVIEEVEAWQNRPLDPLYPIVYLDAIRIKTSEEGRILNKAVHLAVGINIEGHKEVLGLWIDKNEGAKFWLKIVTDIKNRGVEDIFIACVDGLKGFTEAINTVFPYTQVQLCIVHMVRYSLNYVPYKDRKLVARDLKEIYTSANKETAKNALETFKKNWNNKYPTIADSWERNWIGLTSFLDYPDYIRKAIYTTNAIESINYSIRKIIKNRSLFPNDLAVKKILYLSLKNIQKRWTMPIHEWKLALNQFAILFAERFPKKLGDF